MKKTLLSALVVIALTAQLTGCNGNTPVEQPSESSSVVSDVSEPHNSSTSSTAVSSSSEPQSSTASTTSSTSETSESQNSTTATTSNVPEVSEPQSGTISTTSSSSSESSATENSEQTPVANSPKEDFVIWYQRVGGLTITGYEGNGGDVVIPEEFEGKSGEGMAVTGIGRNPVTNKGAFDDITSITSITIPKTICGIDSLFNGCTNLTNINVDDSNKNLASVDGILCERTENGLRLIRCPEGKKGKAVIPDSVTEIAEGSFSGCNEITEIIVGNGVTKVNKDILGGCVNLKHLTLGNGISRFGCPPLVAEGDTLEDFESLETVVFGDGLAWLGDGFNGCTNLKKVVLGKKLETIDRYAFAGCSSLNEIDIPKSVTRIDEGAFAGTAWLENKRKENPLVVVNGILIDGTTCSGNVTIPNGITEIGYKAFAGSDNITSVTVTNGVVSIQDGAFSNCANLKKVILPDSIKYIAFPMTMGYPAFYESPNVTVTYKGKTYTQSNMEDLYNLFN